jgi:hypothetical protein
MSNLLPGNVVVTEPIGYRYGPDTNLIAVWIEYDVAGLVCGGAELNLVYDGIMDVDDPYQEGPDAASMRTPTGSAENPPENSIILDLYGSVTPFRFIEASTHLFFVYNENFLHVPGVERFDAQWVFTLTFKLNTHSW